MEGLTFGGIVDVDPVYIEGILQNGHASCIRLAINARSRQTGAIRRSLVLSVGTCQSALHCATFQYPGPGLAAVKICGAGIGIKWAIYRQVPPPLRRRFARSSVIEAFRWIATPGCAGATAICPRTPEMRLYPR